ncbi:helix-turn-helix transcriptional regulator [Streptomyces sp. NPDC002855]|uniref:helix-turn-helix transcriptional regulator n=1 Tax=Streptomyces sp. NPDC002855 TaxID=3154437 RepID=UPI003322283B
MTRNQPEAMTLIDFGAWLEQQARQAGYATQSQLAKAVGVSEGQVSKWIKGKNAPEAKSMQPLANALNAEVLELYVRVGWISAEQANVTLPDREALDPRVARFSRALRLVDELPEGQRAIAERVTSSIEAMITSLEQFAAPFSRHLGLPSVPR